MAKNVLEDELFRKVHSNLDLSGWKQLKQKLMRRLKARNASPEDAAAWATGLSDLWLAADSLRNSLEEFAESDDPDRKLVDVLLHLEWFQRSTPPSISLARRVWRRLTGLVWNGKQSQVAQIRYSLKSWLSARAEPEDVPRAIVDLRRSAESLAVVLSDVNLFALERGRSRRGVLGRMRRSVEDVESHASFLLAVLGQE